MRKIKLSVPLVLLTIMLFPFIAVGLFYLLYALILFFAVVFGLLFFIGSWVWILLALLVAIQIYTTFNLNVRIHNIQNEEDQTENSK